MAGIQAVGGGRVLEGASQVCSGRRGIWDENNGSRYFCRWDLPAPFHAGERRGSEGRRRLGEVNVTELVEKRRGKKYRVLFTA